MINSFIERGHRGVPPGLYMVQGQKKLLICNLRWFVKYAVISNWVLNRTSLISVKYTGNIWGHY